MKLTGNILGTSLGESKKEFLKRDEYFFHSNNFLYPVYEIRKIKWKHGHLSVYALQRFSHGKNDRSELKFFAHLPQTSLMGKHEKTEILFTFLTLFVVSFHSGTQVGHTKTRQMRLFSDPLEAKFFSKIK